MNVFVSYRQWQQVTWSRHEVSRETFYLRACHFSITIAYFKENKFKENSALPLSNHYQNYSGDIRGWAVDFTLKWMWSALGPSYSLSLVSCFTETFKVGVYTHTHTYIHMYIFPLTHSNKHKTFSKSYTSYFIMLAHSVRGQCWWYGSRGWAFPPVFHYMLLPCDW